mmetsp:Transcript_23560/g.69755  ORF Transcript_23560/g.69755 Transcript_23560/m.69755 type:complete len:225 (-) Transcript_23560:125-799(-)
MFRWTPPMLPTPPSPSLQCLKTCCQREAAGTAFAPMRDRRRGGTPVGRQIYALFSLPGERCYRYCVPQRRLPVVVHDGDRFRSAAPDDGRNRGVASGPARQVERSASLAVRAEGRGGRMGGDEGAEDGGGGRGGGGAPRGEVQGRVPVGIDVGGLRGYFVRGGGGPLFPVVLGAFVPPPNLRLRTQPQRCVLRVLLRLRRRRVLLVLVDRRRQRRRVLRFHEGF